MKQIIYVLLVVSFSMLLLTSCLANNDSSTDKNNEQINSNDHESSHEEGEEDREDDKVDEEEHESEKDQSDQSDDNYEEDKHHLASISKQLKMDDANIKLPTDFPVSEEVNANVVENTSTSYTVEYKAESKQEIASFTGILYDSVEEAKNNVDELMTEKAVPKNGETETDLGYGIKGYGEGTAGHAHFGWEEGNWTLAIKSVSEDEMDNPAIARKMVDYLESEYLPAPKDRGIIYADYLAGGNRVNVEIRWQENNMVYKLKTNEVPLDALKMAVSVE